MLILLTKESSSGLSKPHVFFCGLTCLLTSHSLIADRTSQSTHWALTTATCSMASLRAPRLCPIDSKKSYKSRLRTSGIKSSPEGTRERTVESRPDCMRSVSVLPG